MKRMILILLFAMAMPATARIGETPTQCETRYGKPLLVDKENKVITYHKSGLKIQICYLDGVAQMIYFTKLDQELDQNARNVPARLSNAEISKLLEANGSGKIWRGPIEGENLDAAWYTDKQERVALYGRKDHVLVVATDDYKKYVAAQLAEQSKKKAQQKLAGF